MKYLQFVLLVAFCCFNHTIFSQTGPGGVGKTTGNANTILRLWLDANTIQQADNTEVTSWLDESRFGNNATATTGTGPELQLNQVNGYPQVEFDIDNSEFLRVDDHTSLKPNKISVFVVGNLTNSSDSWGAFISKTTNGSWDDGYALYRNNGESIGAYVNDWSTINVTTAIQYDANQIMTLRSRTDKLNLFKNEENTGGVSFIGDINNSDEDLFLGKAEGEYYLDGDIAETIILKRQVKGVERIIIHNYLSAKYNIPLEVRDYYVQDDSANGNFDHHVAGIGRIKNNNKHTDSQGTGVIRINNPSNLQEESFLFWGEESKDVAYNFSTVTGNDSNQLNSKWRVSQRGTLGAVDVSFDTAAINLSGFDGCSGLRLVVDNDSDFSSPTVYALPVSGGIAQATGVSFNDGDYFTIRDVAQIIWDGARYFNGSGLNQAPNDSTDKCLKLLVKAGTKAVLSQNAYVREIEVEIGAILEVADGVELSVENKIENNGTIDLLGEAQLIQKHTGVSTNSGIGKLYIRQQGTSNLYNYNYWSSPVNRNGAWQIGFLEHNDSTVLFNSAHDANPNTSPITLSSRWLYSYNASIAVGYYGWLRLGTTTPVLPGIGYTIKGSGSANLDEEFVFSGEANNGDYTYPVTANYDFLVGNPYPSALNAQQFILDNLDVTDGTLYFYEQFESNNTHVLRDYQGGYATLNLLTGVAAAANSQLGNGGTATKGAPTNNIAVGQGFYVSIKQDDVLQFNNAQRVFAKESNGESVFYRQNVDNSVVDTRIKFWLSFSDPSGRASEIALGYDENATQGLDKGYDAVDYSGYSNSMLWSIPDNLLVIQGLNQFSEEDIMPLAVKIETAGIYTIGLSKTLNFPENTAIYLKDSQSNTFYNLKTEDISLALGEGVFNNRFSIVYQQQQQTLDMPILEENQVVNVKFDENTETLQLLGVENLNTINAAYIYAVDGKQLDHHVGLESNYITTSHLSDGVYVLKLEMISGSVENIKFVKY